MKNFQKDDETHVELLWSAVEEGACANAKGRKREIWRKSSQKKELGALNDE